MNSIGDLLRDSVACDAEPFAATRRVLTSAMTGDGPVVVWLHGAAGSMRDRLLANAITQLEQAGFEACCVDCRTVEPTPAAFLDLIAATVGVSAEIDLAASAFSTHVDRPLLILDHYEVFRLADSWLRREFIPALATNARVLLISNEPPSAGWTGNSAWGDQFATIALPALEMQDNTVNSDDFPTDADPDLQQASHASAVVRRVTRPMLEALCPDIDASSLYDRLAGLPLFESRDDGLAMRESGRRHFNARLQAADPARYRQFQQRAWRVLRRQLREAPRADLWRYTADTIFLLQNPVIREAFFPSESSQYVVEPSQGCDQAAIFGIVDQHEGKTNRLALKLWWQHIPEAFHVVRDRRHEVVGFYTLARPGTLGADWMNQDPVARNWCRHLADNGRHRGQQAIFLRRWLATGTGEKPSPIQAAAWVDIKRSYLELRPGLRRVYLCLDDLAPYAAVASELGFQVLPELQVGSGDVAIDSAVLDFGPGSVDGWISNLLAAELGITADQVVDSARRELCFPGGRVPLTRLEYDLVSMLAAHQGGVVSRDKLLREVWGHKSTVESNVVDALVAGLRKKCGADKRLIETVRGIGYRLVAW